MTESFDIAIIGAGMAGASLAAELVAVSHAPRVVLLEAEDQPGYHSTGRSAAFWVESYGGPGVQPLTTASGPFLREGGFLRDRGALTIGKAGQEARVAEFAETFAARGVQVEMLGRDRLDALIPDLRPEWVIGAHEVDCCDIDVAALHQHYLSAARKAGVDLRCRARAETVEAASSGWRIGLADGTCVEAGIVVNAAGAWADSVAAMCGVRAPGISPYRRTIAQVRVSRPVPAHMPLVLDIDETFYFKPEGAGLWLSPHDETPSPPCDAAPEEIDVALSIDRLEGVVDWTVERVEHRWAGLRSFAPDRLPVYGFDPHEAGFFWFAGQGGFGIQTAPAAARLAAGLILGTNDSIVDPQPYSPQRFA
ncbi:MAG: FAD-binding oxidoreductase [Novosphingobium sp.]|nr:FAD-binding oxidoreductase [Novosphingobium sp.]